MPTIKLTSNVESGTGPFTYEYTAVDNCGDILFVDPDGNESTNEISFSSDNPIVTIEATFTDADCTNDELLAKFSLTVTGADGVCTAISEVSKDNPCFEFTGSLTAGPYNGSTQEVVATAGNGNYPFTYVFSTELVITEQNDNKITVIRTNVENSLISVAITDTNGCVANVELNLPPANQNPTLENYSIQLDCDNVPVVLDIVALASDIDGVIDLGTIEVIQIPTKGVTVIDAAVGIITYTANPAETGTDTFSYRVRDNNGNYSNLAVANIVITPCLDAPVAVADNYAIDCETKTTITPVLNDTDTDGVIDPSSVVILTTPFHGTAVVQADGGIIYNPHDGFEGADHLRYLVYDNDNLVSNIGLVSITVNPCCDAHNADMNITCSTASAPFEMTAFGLGTIPNILTDIIEVNEGGGYAAGTTGSMATDCSAVDNIYVNGTYTQPDGTFFAPNELAADLIITPLGGNNFRVHFDFDEPHNPAFIQSLREYMLNCDGVWRLGGALLPVTEFSFLSANISGFISSSNFLQFDYLNLPDSGSCATEINAEADNTSIYLAGLGAPSTTAVRWLNFNCLTFGSTVGTLTFRRTITRTGCPDIVIEKEVIVSDIEDPCNNFSLTTLQDGGGTGVIKQTENFEALVDISNAASLITVMVGGVNILSSGHQLDTVGLLAIEEEVQTYLDNNGAMGTATVLMSTNTLFIQVKDVVAGLLFEQIETNDNVVGLFNAI